MTMSYPYPQPKLQCMMREPAGTPRTMLVQGSEISPHSIAFTAESFIHPTTIGKIALPIGSSTPRIVGGSVLSCRHVKGRDHAVVFGFDDSIDLDGILDPIHAAAYKKDKAAAEENIADGLPELTVLYLDDHEPERRLIVHRMQGSNITISPFAHLGAAMDAIETSPFDLVLCDLYLEDPHTAHDLLASMRDRGMTVPVVILTSEVDPESGIKLATEGAAAVISKPVDYSRIARQLTQIALHASGSNEQCTDDTDPATRSFIESFAERRMHLKRAITQRNQADAMRICRDLAGGSAGFGFTALGRVADRAIGAIESAGSIDLAGKPMDDLLSQLERLAAASAASA